MERLKLHAAVKKVEAFGFDFRPHFFRESSSSSTSALSFHRADCRQQTSRPDFHKLYALAVSYEAPPDRTFFAPCYKQSLQPISTSTRPHSAQTRSHAHTESMVYLDGRSVQSSQIGWRMGFTTGLVGFTCAYRNLNTNTNSLEELP